MARWNTGGDPLKWDIVNNFRALPVRGAKRPTTYISLLVQNFYNSSYCVGKSGADKVPRSVLAKGVSIDRRRIELLLRPDPVASSPPTSYKSTWRHIRTGRPAATRWTPGAARPLKVRASWN